MVMVAGFHLCMHKVKITRQREETSWKTDVWAVELRSLGALEYVREASGKVMCGANIVTEIVSELRLVSTRVKFEHRRGVKNCLGVTFVMSSTNRRGVSKNVAETVVEFVAMRVVEFDSHTSEKQATAVPRISKK